MQVLKRGIIFVLIYILSIPVNYLPFFSKNELFARKLTITSIDLYVENNRSFSKRSTKFIDDELKNRNRIQFFEHGVEYKTEKKIERVYDSSKFSEVSELVEDLGKFIAAKEYAVAVEQCQQIIDVYEENFEHLKDFQPLYESYLKRSFVQDLAGLRSDSKKSLNQAISIGRNRTFAANKFSPRFVVKYKRERKRGKKKAISSIKVETLKNIELFIDGKSYGYGSLELSNLSPGKHFIIYQQKGKVLKKEIVNIKKGENVETSFKPNIAIKKETNDPSSILTKIDSFLSKKLIDAELKDLLNSFADSKKADFILFGYTNKSSSLYKAQIYLYNDEKKEIAFLTEAEFDEDLLTGEVEGLRVGNEVVKGMDNFSSLKLVPLTKSSEIAVVKKISSEKYKNIEIKGSLDIKKIPDENKVIAKKKEIKKDKKVIKKDKKKIKIDDADYSKLNKDTKNFSVLDNKDKKYQKKDKKGSSFYETWWFWTLTAVVVAGAGTGIYFLTVDNDTTTKSDIIIEW